MDTLFMLLTLNIVDTFLTALTRKQSYSWSKNI